MIAHASSATSPRDPKRVHRPAERYDNPVALIQLLVFGYAATFDLNHVPIAIYDQDHSQASRDLIARFALSPTFTVKDVLDSGRSIDELIDSRQVQTVLVVDRRFTRDLLTHRSAPVQVILDGRNSNTALLIRRLRQLHRQRVRAGMGPRARRTRARGDLGHLGPLQRHLELPRVHRAGHRCAPHGGRDPARGRALGRA
jgi:hypothetical protein